MFGATVFWLDPNILQTALLQVAEATQAAGRAAQAAAQSTQRASTSAGSAGGQVKPAIDWSKFVNTPPIFGENSAADEDIKFFREWLWQLTQFLVTIDSANESEVKQVTDVLRSSWILTAPLQIQGDVQQSFTV